MSALDSLVNSERYTDTDTQHRERAAAELAAMRQLISEQMERIEQQQTVVDAAWELDDLCGWNIAKMENSRNYEIEGYLLKQLAIALAALPQPATKGKHG
jgi:hypothetical protein